MQKGTDTEPRSPYARGMSTRRWRIGSRAAPTVLALCLAVPTFAQQAKSSAVIWHDRGDAASLDLVGGPGGKAHEPGSVLRFIEESETGTSPKFEVEDEHGVRWKVKLGEEAKSETAATRLLWAAGYVVDEDYYRPGIRVVGLPRLARGQEFVTDEGIVTGARLERHGGGGEESATWSWYDNPFVGTREFNGLRVMMALVNNWDLKDVNNRVSDTAEGGGSTASPTWAPHSDAPATSSPAARASRKTTRRRSSSPRSRPRTSISSCRAGPSFPSSCICPTTASGRAWRTLSKRIPIADARWIGDRLGRLSAGADP